MKSLTIGHLARESGVNLETVRYYERRGLLPKPPRSASGYRLFPIEATRRRSDAAAAVYSASERTGFLS